MSNTSANITSNIKLWRPDGDAYELVRASGMTGSMSRQISQDYMFGVVEEGQANINYRGENHKVAGTCFLQLNPDEPFSRQGDAQHPRSVRMLIASPAFLQQQISELTEHEAQLPQFDQPIIFNKDIIQVFSRIHCALEMPHSRLERDSWLQDIIALLLKHCTSDHAAQIVTGKESKRVKAVRAFLMEQYTENISLEKIAGLVNLSTYRLNRVFSQEVGIPPHAFLNQVRVWQAKLLLEKSTPIAEVATEVGFYDQSHLTRHFKRLMGFTPGVILEDKKTQLS
jgi:AraC-like DNA-binding protein